MLRHPALAGMPRAGRSSPIHLEWYGPVKGQPRGTLLSKTPQGWSLEAINEPSRAEPVAVALIEDEPHLEKLGEFDGTVRRAECASASVTVLNGALAGTDGPVPACRVRFDGVGHATLTALADSVPLRVPRAGLAASALAALGKEQPGIASGIAPATESGTAAAAAGAIVADLATTLFQWTALIGAEADQDGKPVHQARVAIRRLRSALSVFRAVTACDETGSLIAGLKDLFGRLGQVRDWDVFLAETGPELAAAVPDEPRLAALLKAARQRQATARAELKSWLSSPAWRRLGVSLAAFAALRPWEPDRDGGILDAAQQQVAAFARDHLRHARKRLLKAGPNLSELRPEALHDLRKRCKRLRYAAEFFAPLFDEKPARRFLKRLGRVQDALGHMNDAAVAGHLMGKLGRGHEFASGAVQGWAAARAGMTRKSLDDCWRRLRKAEPFW